MQQPLFPIWFSPIIGATAAFTMALYWLPKHLKVRRAIIANCKDTICLETGKHTCFKRKMQEASRWAGPDESAWYTQAFLLFLLVTVAATFFCLLSGIKVH